MISYSICHDVDCYVTCRFHGVLFAHLLGVPALAMAPHPKVRALMEDFGLSQYCLDIAECDLKDLTRAFERLVANADEVKDRIRAKSHQSGSAHDAIRPLVCEFPREWRKISRNATRNRSTKVNATQHPLVSVVTPVYNGERYMRECIESVLCQSIKIGNILSSTTSVRTEHAG